MSVSLTKGGNVSLTKEAPGLTNVVVGLGWDIRTTTGTDFDLDASAIVLGADGKVLSDKPFVFFNNLTSPDGTVELARYDLTEDASTETAMVFGELYRNGADWKFRAVGQGYASGLAGIARDFGVNV